MTTNIPASIQKKADTLVTQLKCGIPPFQCGAKRLGFVSPNLVSIPLGSYRLLCEYRRKGCLKSIKVMHHGAYEDYLRRYSKR